MHIVRAEFRKAPQGRKSDKVTGTTLIASRDATRVTLLEERAIYPQRLSFPPQPLRYPHDAQRERPVPRSIFNQQQNQQW